MNDDKIHGPWFFGYLMLTAILCGGFVMVVEVLGSRVLGPFFGVGLFVWTSLIAVALLSLALGYWLAGIWADKREHPDNLYAIIFIAGLLVLLTPFIKVPVLALCMPLGLRWGAFVSTFILFGPSLFVLGCVSPYLIKIATKEFHSIGRTVGLFSAISTLGSTIGTVATGFFLIAYFHVDVIFALSSLVLISISVIYFVLFRKRYWFLLALLIPILSWPVYEPIDLIMSDGTHMQEVSDRSSYYGHIKVIDYTFGDKHVRDLLIDGLTQGGFDMVNRVSLYEYPYLMQVIPYGLHTEGERALIVGLGAGVIPMWYESKGVRVDAVEIDPVVVEIAQEYFDYKVSGETYVNDARYFLSNNQQRYDYIMMDVFNGDLTPGLLISLEAFKLVKRSLTDDGIFTINLIANIKDNTAGTHSVLNTLKLVFEHVNYYPIYKGRDTEITNVIVVAYNGKEKRLDHRTLSESHYYPGLRQTVMNSVMQPLTLAAPERTPIILRDDYNPLDTWDSETREAVRNNILQSRELSLLMN